MAIESAMTNTTDPLSSGTDRQRTTEEHNLSEWDLCDEHEMTFPKGTPCPGCIAESEVQEMNQRYEDYGAPKW